MRKLIRYGLVVLTALLIGGMATAQDSIRISVKAAKKVFAAAEESKILQQRLDTCFVGQSIINARVDNLTEQVNQCANSRSHLQGIVTTYEKKIIRVETENTRLLRDNLLLQKKVTKQRKRNFWTTTGALVGGVVGTFFILR